MKWKKIEEDNPPYMAWVWVAVNSSASSKRFTSIAEYDGRDFWMVQAAHEYQNMDGTFDEYGMTITHWAELDNPEPPEDL